MKPGIAIALISTLLLFGCGEKAPIRVGFVGGLSDRNSDVGQSGLNGVILAIEQTNRAGGIDGRLLELISRDDAQTPETAKKSASELVEAKVEAVIGPFTSGMAAVTVPILEKAGILSISPTLTAMTFYGKDDYLIRINRTTRDNTRDYARMLAGRGQKRIAVAYDTRNRVFTESWLSEFRDALAAEGATLAAEVPYESKPDTDFVAVIEQMLKGKPDSLFYISGAIDVARLAQQSRRLAPELPIGASEWAATEQLLELGGKVVDGLLILQNYNRDDEHARYRDFQDAYVQRFQRKPGYSSVSAYDAATVLVSALKKRNAGESAKAAVLKYGPYQGLQQEIAFDANGDTTRKVFFTEIRSGRFVVVDK